MLEEYAKHNLFRESLKKFTDEDPQLSLLKNLKYVHPMDWWKDVDWNHPGIFILTGGRQIGKTTSTKLLIRDVLKKKMFSPKCVFYLPCDQIDDYHHLSRVLRFLFEEVESKSGKLLLVIDEITFVKDWDRSIKAFADEGRFRDGFCIITGSDSVILKEAASRFPGRRGDADVVDFHLYPLTFHDYVELISPKFVKKPESDLDSLFQHFEKYLTCGGYLRAINDLHSIGEISKATYAVFEQWISGDFEKRGKTTDTLTGILNTLMTTSTSQTTYSALAQKLGRVSKETFINYCSLLERMDIIFNLQAFDQNTRRGFPKKARKFHFADPFIIDTISMWLDRTGLRSEKDLTSIKVESVVAEHIRRLGPAYYLKGEGEIDVIAVAGKKFVPLEIKWTNQLRPTDIKQLKKFPNSRILTKQRAKGKIQDIPCIPLPLFLVEPLSPLKP